MLTGGCYLDERGLIVGINLSDSQTPSYVVVKVHTDFTVNIASRVYVIDDNYNGDSWLIDTSYSGLYEGLELEDSNIATFDVGAYYSNLNNNHTWILRETDYWVQFAGFTDDGNMCFYIEFTDKLGADYDVICVGADFKFVSVSGQLDGSCQCAIITTTIPQDEYFTIYIVFNRD